MKTILKKLFRPVLPQVLLPLSLCISIASTGLLAPEILKSAVSGFSQWGLSLFGPLYIILPNFFLLVCLSLPFTKLGRIKIGGPEAKREFNHFSWVAMLFAAGMGSGLVFWGIAEPLTHFNSPPPNSSLYSLELATELGQKRWANYITFFHWGLHAWAIYAVAGLCVAYFGYNLKRPFLASAPLYSLQLARPFKFLAQGADLLSIFAVVFGVVGALGMGALLIHSGLESLIDLPAKKVVLSTVVLILTLAFSLSASSSLKKGIQLLSFFNLLLGFTLMGVVFLLGPSMDILHSLFVSIKDYLLNIFSSSLSLSPFTNSERWNKGWTLTYFVWWIAWAPFVGIFIARISRGRSLREFLWATVLLPSLMSFVWFSVFSESGYFWNKELQGMLGQAIAKNPNSGLFLLFENLPATNILSLMALLLMSIFLVTSADSASYVLGMISSKGNPHPSSRVKLFWALLIGSIGFAALLVDGGIEALKSLAIVGALPFTFVLLLQSIALLWSLKNQSSG